MRPAGPSTLAPPAWARVGEQASPLHSRRDPPPTTQAEESRKFSKSIVSQIFTGNLTTRIMRRYAVSPSSAGSATAQCRAPIRATPE